MIAPPDIGWIFVLVSLGCFGGIVIAAREDRRVLRENAKAGSIVIDGQAFYLVPFRVSVSEESDAE